MLGLTPSPEKSSPGDLSESVKRVDDKVVTTTKLNRTLAVHDLFSHQRIKQPDVMDSSIAGHS